MRTAVSSKCKEILAVYYYYYSAFLNNRYCSYSSLHDYGFSSPFNVKLIRVFTRSYHCTQYFKCIAIRVSKGCQVGVLSGSVGKWQSLSTLVSLEETNDEVLNQVLALMEDPSVSREEVCFRYIQKLCAAGNLLAAARLIKMLQGRHIILSPRAYNYLMETAGERNNIDLLSELFKDLLMSSGSVSLTSYLIFARVFSSHENSAVLLNLISEVSEMALPRIDIVLNRIIFAFAKCGLVERALLIFTHLKCLKCKPDLVTYNTILAILGRLGRVDEMLHEFTFMKTTDLIPDIFTYNTVLHSLRKMGRLDLCLVYFKEMSDRGIQPDMLTFKAMIESLGRSGNIEEALKIFSEMKRKGIRPSVHIYRALIFSLKKMGKLELALKISNEMNECLLDIVGPRDFQYDNR